MGLFHTLQQGVEKGNKSLENKGPVIVDAKFFSGIKATVGCVLVLQKDLNNPKSSAQSLLLSQTALL